MKKILAIALVLMMLLASAACAESNVTAITITDPHLETVGHGGTKTADLTGTTIAVLLGSLDGKLTANITLNDGENKVASGVVQLDGNTVIVYVDGMSKAYKRDITDILEASSFKDTLNTVIGVASIPSLDLTSAIQTVMTKASDGYDLTIPTSALKTWAHKFLNYNDQVNAVSEGTAKYVGSVVDRIADTVTLTGAYTDGVASVSATQTAHTATASAKLTIAASDQALVGITAPVVDAVNMRSSFSAEDKATLKAEGNTLFDVLKAYLVKTGVTAMIPAK